MIFINNHLNIQVNSLGDRKVALEKMLSSSFHGKLKEDVEELEINPEDIESIDLTRQYDVFDVSGLV
jgi:hypothetical protein